jgi:hypothetical protein
MTDFFTSACNFDLGLIPAFKRLNSAESSRSFFFPVANAVACRNSIEDRFTP